MQFFKGYMYVASILLLRLKVFFSEKRPAVCMYAIEFEPTPMISGDTT